MQKIQEEIQKLLKRYNINLSESTVSTILGVVVVLVIGLLVYNYFRINQQSNVTPGEVSTSADENKESGDLTTPGMSVALPTTHTVSVGENLWTIAEKYYASGYNFVDIAAVNRLTNKNLLMVGQKLTIPKVEVRKPLAMSGKIYPAVIDNKIDGNSYAVQKGDSLWTIALRSYGDGFKWVEIAKANKLAQPDWIHSGNVLVLPR